MTYLTTYANMHATSLDAEQHERTCGYWYTVTCGASAHTAFETRDGLERWLAERGLSLAKRLPAIRGTFASTPVTGYYRAISHGEFLDDWPAGGMGSGEFYSLVPVLATAVMSNGRYTLGLVTEDGDGVRTVHTLNPNVHTRVVFDQAAARKAMR